MDFSFTQEQKRLRQEVRDFLEDEVGRRLWKPSCDAWIQGHNPAFTKRVAQRGWIGLTWPRQYGGQERSFLDRLIVTEEMLRYGAPAACHWFSDRQIGGSILSYGSEEQKQEFLPKIVRGDMYVGLGMSEPESGSDLASLKMRATEEDEVYVVNGQKTWTSGASFINCIDLFARTDMDAPKHRGISEFLVPMDLPGTSRIPMIDITGTEAWNDIFFDNVRVPKRCMIGEKNRGFYQVIEQLAYERGGMERLMGNYALFDAIITFVKETECGGRALSQDAIVRHKLAQLQVEFEVGRLLMYKVATVMDEGRPPTVEAAVSKSYATAFEQRLANTAMEILGPYGVLQAGSKYAPFEGLASHSYLGSKGYSLQAGSREILKNIIATRGLGLPTD
ncbi:MAG: acyl-CoA dehydrogenase family protein [Dehalococcoidia bacterium]|nr:acyl-CoA dehydrogenase family protein [Dehalococcoidia bacterium]